MARPAASARKPVAASAAQRKAPVRQASKGKSAPAPVSESESEVESEVESEDDDEEDEEEDEDEDDEDEEDEDEDEEDGSNASPYDSMDEDMEDEDGADSEAETVDGEDQPLAKTSEDVVDDLTYDLFNLTACSYHPLQWANDTEREETIVNAATRVAQLLFKRLRDLPTESSDIGPLCVLPTKEVFILPRTNKIPEPKPETKWEKFARERGIKKQKKDRMVYDEEAGEYRPRWGYKRANGGVEELPIVEVKEGEDANADPWAKARKDKKDRVKKNLKNQMKNMVRAEKQTKGAAYTPEKFPGIPVEFNSGKRGKGGVRKALQLAQHSTASMGRFDEMRPGEPARKLSGKKRSFRDNLTPASDEKVVMRSQLRIVEDKLQKKAKGVTNSLAAYEGILPDAPSLSFKKSKGRGKNADKPKKR